MSKSILTYNQRQYILKHYKFESAQRMGDRFGVSRTTVAKFIKSQGLIITQDDRFNILANSQSTATSKEDRYIIKYYLKYPIKTLASRIDRSDTFVRTRLNVLGLSIPQEIIQQRKEASRIKPGNVPPNKGKKMPRAQYRIAKATMFKPGNKPANTLFNGAITIRKDNRGVPQKFIRIRKGKWDYLSRYNYREFKGPIPSNCVVAFIDKDTLNCDPSNLQLITKAENAARNRDSQYPPETRDLIRLNNKLKKAIHAKKQNPRSA